MVSLSNSSRMKRMFFSSRSLSLYGPFRNVKDLLSVVSVYSFSQSFCIACRRLSSLRNLLVFKWSFDRTRNLSSISFSPVFMSLANPMSSIVWWIFVFLWISDLKENGTFNLNSKTLILLPIERSYWLRWSFAKQIVTQLAILKWKDCAVLSTRTMVTIDRALASLFGDTYVVTNCEI